MTIYETSDHSPLAPVMTLVGWTVCLAVGILGFLLPYSGSRPAVKPPESVRVQRLVVELSPAPPAPTENEPRPGAPGSSVAVPAETVPAPPQAVAVAAPSPAIAFAVPVEGATRVVPLGQATYTRPTHPVAPSAVQRLTFGQGAGRQAAPEYPAAAIQQHQEGTVVVRLVVAGNGQVSSAEAVQPCRWPVLNESALRAVRQEWRFPAGDLRVYDVAIRFQIATE